jgi:Arc/MetJ-type ribon-helix-helix transcriptional regulator
MARLTISLPDTIDARMKSHATRKGYPSISNYIQSLIERDTAEEDISPLSSKQASSLSSPVIHLMMKNIIEGTILAKYLVKKDNPAFVQEASQIAQAVLNSILVANPLSDKA